MTRSALAVLAAVVLAVPACKPRVQPPTKSAPAVIPTPHPRDFGDGYKGAKWGMSAADVEKRFGTPIERGPAPGSPDLVRELFAVPGPDQKPTIKRIEAYFWKGKLLRAVFVPHFTDDYARGYDELYRMVVAKYGPGAPIPGMMDPRTGVAVDLVGWTDGTTLIQLRVDRTPAAEVKKEHRTDARKLSTTEVVYTSIDLWRARATAKAPAPALTPAPLKPASSAPILH